MPNVFCKVLSLRQKIFTKVSSPFVIYYYSCCVLTLKTPRGVQGNNLCIAAQNAPVLRACVPPTVREKPYDNQDSEDKGMFINTFAESKNVETRKKKKKYKLETILVGMIK